MTFPKRARPKEEREKEAETQRRVKELSEANITPVTGGEG